jgi:hypothetical protein
LFDQRDYLALFERELLDLADESERDRGIAFIVIGERSFVSIADIRFELASFSAGRDIDKLIKLGTELIHKCIEVDQITIRPTRDRHDLFLIFFEMTINLTNRALPYFVIGQLYRLTSMFS